MTRQPLSILIHNEKGYLEADFDSETNTSVINNNFVASIDSDEVQYLAERKEFYSKV